MTNTDNENTNEVANNTSDYFEFLKNAQGELERDDNGKPILNLHTDYRAALVPNEKHADYCGNGSEKELPDPLIIPSTFKEEEIGGLAPGMFYRNDRVREIVLPAGFETLPMHFCCGATNLHSIQGMEQIRTIEQSALAKTRIKQALFPNLSSLGAFAFAGCAYLEVADIGMVTTIPERTFWGCARLHTVEWNPTKTETEGQTDKFVIGPGAFCQTRSLVDFKFLETARPEDVDAQSAAFFYSKIGISWKPDVNKAFPTTDNNTPFWEDAKYTPCEHRLVTKLSQLNPAWANKTFLSDRGTQYQGACALFAVMHIHSAISGKYYNHPDEFVEELKHNPELSRFLYYRNWPGYFKNVASMFEALGYRTEVHGNGSELSTQNFQALLDALKAGAYIYTQVATLDNYEHGVFDRGHAVVLYGINEFNEVCVLDSNVLHEDFREGGFDPDIDVYTYAMPYQNMVGPGTDFVIVYPPRKHPMQEPHKK